MADYAYITFLDILGYKESLENDVREGTQDFRTKMNSAFRSFEAINQSVHKYQAISDSIFMSCSDRQAIEDLLKNIRVIFTSFLKEGLLIRGGVSFGQHFQNHSMTYSPALTKAYLLESKVAEFPRVMVDSNVLSMFPNLTSDNLVLRTGANWFLNIVDKESISEIWSAAHGCYVSNKTAVVNSERVRSKHKWLHDYLMDMHDFYGYPTPAPYLRSFDLPGENAVEAGDLNSEKVLPNLISN